MKNRLIKNLAILILAAFGAVNASAQYDESQGPPPPQGQPGGGSYRTMSQEEMEEMFGSGGADPFSDFFHTFFGQGGGAVFPECAGAAGGAAGHPPVAGADVRPFNERRSCAGGA